jgi:hypothetical protein
MFIYEGNLDTLVAEYKAALNSIDKSRLSFYEIAKAVEETFFPQRQYVSKAAKPRLKSNTPSSEEILEYQNYVNEYEAIKLHEEKVMQISAELSSLRNEYLDNELKSYLNSTGISIQYYDKILQSAYDRGHDNGGYIGIYNELVYLTDIFC